ncbi:MAG: glycosyltransferase family 2 protein [Nitrososphaerota archaeon]|nr:glycosyltransferase family 2 protein [Nitrososphaerota archaeon]MDG6946944.1 glycosyltransferase family 2 protein [Nitrososphaerota archaeon]MDG6950645.1 glycosyltransferase family 2 protein [Nitrososphaerota archaeon]
MAPPSRRALRLAEPARRSVPAPSPQVPGAPEEKEAREVLDVCIPTLHGASVRLMEDIRRFFPGSRVLTEVGRPRWAARQALIDRVESDWFVFTDDDNRLTRGIMEDASALMKDGRVGAVTFHGKDLDPRWPSYGQGPMGLTLIRVAAVRGIRIPPMISGEDSYIRLYVGKMGYRWMELPGPYYEHHRLRTFRDGYERGFWGYAIGSVRLRTEIPYILFLWPLRVLKDRPRYFFFCMARRLNIIRGAVHARLVGVAERVR